MDTATREPNPTVPLPLPGKMDAPSCGLERMNNPSAPNTGVNSNLKSTLFNEFHHQTLEEL
jgi:hypothetical protein